MKSLLVREKSVSLHPLKQNNGRVAQLNRVADYGSAGYRFESCRDHESSAFHVEDFFFAHFIEKNSLNKAYYGKAFSKFEYLGEISVVCQLPFGDISAYVNHYSSPKREWNVGLSIGWQLFNYRFIE